MGRAIFIRPIGAEDRGVLRRPRGVQIGTKFASWTMLRSKAAEQVPALKPARTYVVDPTAGLETFAALLAVAMTPDAALIWAQPADVPFSVRQIFPGLFACPDRAVPTSGRPLFATLTSGTSGAHKIAVGWGDFLELVALQYETALYRSPYLPESQVHVLATCLPLKFGATFLMAVIPAMFLSYDLVVFPPHRWDFLHAVAAREPVACITVPSLLAAASASSSGRIDMSKAALLTIAGYLSKSRIESVQDKFQGIRILSSYGATETGVVTLDTGPDGKHFHVGRPILGKPVWLTDVDSEGVGKIATAGPDCRAFYLGDAQALGGTDGTVATTDFGHFDSAGNLYLDGRIDGAMKINGMTIYPQRIERHLLTLPGVVDARVRIDTTNTLERLEARLVGSITEGVVREHCAMLPEECRPSVVHCFAEGEDVYSGHGKL
jgi:acyl-CoA synthetase (AMP-forming)/AMP-acid ligase II